MIRFFIFVEFHLGTLMFAPSRNVLKSKFGRLHRKKKELQNIGQHLPLSSTSMKVKRPCLVKEPFNERNFKRKRVHFQPFLQIQEMKKILESFRVETILTEFICLQVY